MTTLDRSYLKLMMEAGYIYMGMRRFREAKQVFEGVAALAPDNEVPVIALGSVAFCKGDIKGAVAAYHQALKVDPTSLFAQVYLGEALLFSGKKDEGLALLKEVHKRDRKGPAGEFAAALIDAVKGGFDPNKAKDRKKEKGAHGTSPRSVH